MLELAKDVDFSSDFVSHVDAFQFLAIQNLDRNLLIA